MDISNSLTHDRLQLLLQDVKFLHDSMVQEGMKLVQQQLPGLEGNMTDENSKALNEEVVNSINKFIVEVFDLAKPNLTIDGVNGPDLPKLNLDQNIETQELEPFDVGLNDQVRDMYARVENLTTQVSKLRKNEPLLAIEEYKNSMEKINSQYQEIQANINNDSNGDATRVDVLPEISKSTPNDYNELLTLISQLKRKIPSALATLNRADEVSDTLINLAQDTSTTNKHEP